MTNTPSIYDFPYCLELTDLNNGSTQREYSASKDEVLTRIKSVDEENIFAAGWDRQPGELIGTSHESIDAAIAA